MNADTSAFCAKLGDDAPPEMVRDMYRPPSTPPLAALRRQFSELATALGDRFGADSDPCVRAEQVAAALQRLEWALERSKLRRLARAVSAGRS